MFLVEVEYIAELSPRDVRLMQDLIVCSFPIEILIHPNENALVVENICS